MPEAANYSALEFCRNGQRFEVRSLKPDDRSELIQAVERTTKRSLFRRFFAAKRTFSEQEISFFVNVDFVNHVALVAVTNERGRATIVGGGRYIIVRPGVAELAFTVEDQYQGQGIGTALMRHLFKLARNAGIRELAAEVLPENGPMLKVFEKSDLGVKTRREAGVVHVTFQIS
jgi:GNAT superfamily N-acetyltransferase